MALIELSRLNKQVENEKSIGEIVDNIAAYILSKLGTLTHLKLQKLTYYVCALYYTFEDKAMIHNDVLVPWEAWVHGPANRHMFNKYREAGLNYWVIKYDPIKDEYSKLSNAETDFIDEVLNVFGKYDGVVLETLTHQEKPWIEARGDLSPYEQSTNIIKYETIKEYFSEVISR